MLPNNTAGEGVPVQAGNTSAADGTKRSNDCERGVGIEEVTEHLKLKLDWFGLGWLKPGPIEQMGDGNLLIPLVDVDGSTLGRVIVDLNSGAIRLGQLGFQEIYPTRDFAASW